MTKKYKIIKQDYYDKADIQIEITEEIVTPVEIKKNVLTVGTLNSTIEFLKDKKAKTIMEIDAEIAKNQEILDSMMEKIDAIEILEMPAN